MHRRADLVAEIYNACWLVRHYRGSRNSHQRAQREQAIQRLGLTVRHAFSVSDNFEDLLNALLDGLNDGPSSPQL